MSIKLGDRVRDSITGFEGIVIAYTKWLTGCDRLSVLPTELKKDGGLVGDEVFDITRLEKVEKRVSEETPPVGGVG